MRQVDFLEVGMENYGPYIDPMIHTFKNDTVTLITGPNGIGKTLSLEALPFVLFGVTSKKAKGDDLVNNTVGKNCKAWTKFNINEDHYIVTRYHKYTRLGNTVIINKNGVDIKKGHREVLPEIERIICPQKAFMNTLMFGQKVKDFFTDLVDSDKKDIFRKILLLQLYTVYYKQTDVKLKEIIVLYNELLNKQNVNSELVKDADEQRTILENQKRKFHEDAEKTIQDLKQSFDQNQLLIKKWKEELNKIEIDESIITDLERELSEIDNQIKAKESKRDINISELKHQKLEKLAEVREKGSDAYIKIKNESIEKTSVLDNKIAKTKEELTDFVSTCQKEKHQIELQEEQLYSSNREIEERIHEINDGVLVGNKSECPTCEQQVTDKTKQILIEKIGEYKKQIQGLKENENILKKEKETITKKMCSDSEKFHEQIDQFKKQKTDIIDDETVQRRGMEQRIQQANEKIEELSQNEESSLKLKCVSEIEEFKAKNEDLTIKLGNLKQQKDKSENVQSILRNLEVNQETIKNQISFSENNEYDMSQINSYNRKIVHIQQKVIKNINDLSEFKKQIGILEFWKKGFSSTGIPSMLIDESIPFINKKIAKYLDMLTNGRYIVSFDTLEETKAGDFRDKISVRVVDTHTKANSRIQLSGGQTRIIDIATILTLGDLQSTISDVKFNILLFDEIFDALDYENVGYVSKVLNKIKIDKSIFIISHAMQDQLEPDETLSFT